MVELIPGPNVEQVKDKFSKTMFRDPEGFIKVYNDGLLNKRSDDITALAKIVTEAYQNVELKNSSFEFISGDEIAIKALEESLEYWKVVVVFQREVTKALDNDLGELYFSRNEKLGFLLKNAPAEDEGPRINENMEDEYSDGSEVPSAPALILEKVGTERVFKNFDEFSEMFADLLTDHNEDLVEVNADAVLNLDSSPISRMYKALQG